MDVVYKLVIIFIVFWVVLIVSLLGVIVCGIVSLVKKKKGESYRKSNNLMWIFAIPLLFIFAGFILSLF